MRRRSRGLVMGVLSAIVVAGCTKAPAGVDGELVDDWASLTPPRPFVPVAGQCHESEYGVDGSLTLYSPVACTRQHGSETAHVGTFVGATAGLAAPPAATSPERRAAYGDCDRRAAEYVGADWRTGRLVLDLVVPSDAGWSGGSRWYRCDLVEVANAADFGKRVQRTGSLRMSLAGNSPLRLTCNQVKSDKDGNISTMAEVPCTTPHNGEFVGVTQVTDDAYPATDAQTSRLSSLCRQTIAKHVGVPADGDLSARSGVAWVADHPAGWRAGNRGVRCYLYLSDRTVSGSLKGTGTKGLPVKYE